MKVFTTLALATVAMAAKGGVKGANETNQGKKPTEEKAPRESKPIIPQAYCQINDSAVSGQMVDLCLHSKPENNSSRVSNSLKGSLSGMAAGSNFEADVLNACGGTDLGIWNGELATDAAGKVSVMADWTTYTASSAISSSWAIEITNEQG